jgi:hypothetical protein
MRATAEYRMLRNRFLNLSLIKNMDAMIKHCYCHLGQIVLIKKILKN